MHKANVESITEGGYHLLGFALAQQPVIYEDAGELLADCFVNQHCGHRRVDATGQSTDHSTLANLRTNAGGFSGAEARHRPGTGQTQHPMSEVAQQRRAVWRMNNFRVEQEAIEPPHVIGDGGEWRAIA